MNFRERYPWNLIWAAFREMEVALVIRDGGVDRAWACRVTVICTMEEEESVICVAKISSVLETNIT